MLNIVKQLSTFKIVLTYTHTDNRIIAGAAKFVNHCQIFSQGWDLILCSRQGQETGSWVLPQGRRLDLGISHGAEDWILGSPLVQVTGSWNLPWGRRLDLRFSLGAGDYILGSPSRQETGSWVLLWDRTWMLVSPTEQETGSWVLPWGRRLDLVFSPEAEDWITYGEIRVPDYDP